MAAWGSISPAPTPRSCPRPGSPPFGERTGLVEFAEASDGVRVRVTFDAEDQYPIEQQRQGWQAILERFARHVEAVR